MSGSEDVPKFGSEFTMRWNLNKLSFFAAKGNSAIESKIVTVPLLDNSEWYLKLVSQGRVLMCFLCRTDNGPDEIRVFYSLSSLDSSFAAEFQTFGRQSTSGKPVVINQEKFISDVSSGKCEDVLHIECRLWVHTAGGNNGGTTLDSPYPVSILMSNQIAVENRSFYHQVENFSSRQESEMTNLGLASANQGGVKLVFRLWTDGQILRVILREKDDSPASGQLFVLKCKIEFVDVFKKRHLLFSDRGVLNLRGDGSDRTWNFNLSMSKKELIEKKDLYLPNDTLLLHCDIDISDVSSRKLLVKTIYDTSDLQSSDHSFQWGMYLDHMYNKNRVLFRLLAILVVILSVVPHLFFENTV